MTFVCDCVYMCVYLWLALCGCRYACVSVGVAQEPQFLCGPICFVLFVLLINEIRGAACWDGPRCTAAPDRPRFLMVWVFSKWMPPLSVLCFSLLQHDFIFFFYSFAVCFPVSNTGGGSATCKVTISCSLVSKNQTLLSLLLLRLSGGWMSWSLMLVRPFSPTLSSNSSPLGLEEQLFFPLPNTFHEWLLFQQSD